MPAATIITPLDATLERVTPPMLVAADAALRRHACLPAVVDITLPLPTTFRYYASQIRCCVIFDADDTPARAQRACA